MRAFKLVLLLMLLSVSVLWANGVAVYNRETGTCLRLVESHVNVTVDNQIAIVNTSQTFFNNINWPFFPKYAFPLPEGASATQLRWQVNDTWYQADIALVIQDSLSPGPGTQWASNLNQYL